MALKSIVDSLDGIPEALHEYYVEIDEGDNAGKFRLDSDHEDPAGLKSALKKERQNGKLLRTLRSKLGISDEDDLDELSELLKTARARREAGDDDDDDDADGDDPAGDRSKNKGARNRRERFDAEGFRQKLEAEFSEKKLMPLQAEKEKLEQKLRTVLLDDKIKSAFIKAGGVAEDADDVVRLTRDRFDLDMETEKITVLDEDGDPMGLTVEKFFSERYREEKPKFFTGSGAAGGGAPAGGARGAGSSGGKGGNIRLSREVARDPVKYRAAREKAAEMGVDVEIVD